MHSSRGYVLRHMTLRTLRPERLPENTRREARQAVPEEGGVGENRHGAKWERRCVSAPVGVRNRNGVCSTRSKLAEEAGPRGEGPGGVETNRGWFQLFRGAVYRKLSRFSTTCLPVFVAWRLCPVCAASRAPEFIL